DNIYPASDQLRRVSVSQGMERDCWLSHAIGKPAPLGDTLVVRSGRPLISANKRLSGASLPCPRSACPLQMTEPRRIRSVLPSDPDCELEIRLSVVDSENVVRIEQQVSIGLITDVSHLSGGSEAAGSKIFADEGEILISFSANCLVGIDGLHVDAVAFRP